MSTNIMVVDDEPEIQRMLGRLLRLEGYEVEEYEDPKAALEAANQNNCNVAILDICMPGMSGVELLKQIRARNPMCAVIMLTGYSNMGNVVECLEHGAVDFFTKPVDDTEEFLRAVSYASDKIARWRRAVGMSQVS